MTRSERWPGLFWRAITFLGAASFLAPHFLPARLFHMRFESTLWVAAYGPVLLGVAGALAMVHARATARDAVTPAWLLVATVLSCAVLAVPVWVADLTLYYVLVVFLFPVHVPSLGIFVAGSIAAHRAHRLAGIGSPRTPVPFALGLGCALATAALRIALLHGSASTAGVAIKGFAPDGTELALAGPRRPPGLSLGDVGFWRTVPGKVSDQPVLSAVPGQAALYLARGPATERKGPCPGPELQRLALDDASRGGWRRCLGSGKSGSSRVATAVAATPAGGVFALGFERGEGQTEGWWIKRFEANGAELTGWDKAFPFDARVNRPNGVACDRSGSVYAFGETGSIEAPGTSAWVRKFDADGREILAGWNKRLKRGGPGRPTTAAVSAVTGSDGALYVLLDTYHVLSLHKFDSDGEEMRDGWPREMPDAERALALAPDPAGGVFLFGHVRDLAAPDLPFRGWIHRFAPDGSDVPGWDKTIDSPGLLSDVSAVAFDPAGGVHFGGYGTASDGKTTWWWIRKFRADGSPSPGWDKTLGEDGSNRLFALVTGRRGELYAFGEGHGYAFSGSLVERWWAY